MAKTSQLPLLPDDNVDGSETLPLIKDGIMARILALPLVQRLAKPFVDAAAASAATAASVVQAPSAMGRPRIGPLQAGASASAQTYSFVETSNEARHHTGIRVFSNATSARTLTVRRFNASSGAQVGPEYSITFPAAPAGGGEVVGTYPVPFTQQPGERLTFYGPASFIAYTSAPGSGDAKGYQSQAGNSAALPTSNVNTSIQLQISFEYYTIAVTGADYLDTKARLAVVESGKLPVAALNSPPSVLANVPGVYGAYGLARLVPSYGGPLVRLRRSSDGEERDFFAKATYPDFNALNASAVAAWRGLASAYVVALYDQAGSGLWYQDDASAQPAIAINSGKAWIAFTAGQYLKPNAQVLAFTNRREGATLATVARIMTAPDALRALINFGKASGSPGRLVLRAATDFGVQGRLSYDDGISGWDVPKLANASGAWFSAVETLDGLRGEGRLNLNGTSSSINVLDQAQITPPSDSASARINGAEGDVGFAWDLHSLMMTNAVLGASEEAALAAALNTVKPDYVAAPASTIWLPGDSQFFGTGIDDPAKRLTAVLSTLSSPRRRVVGRGIPGTAPRSIVDRVLGSTMGANIGPSDVVVLLAGRNPEGQLNGSTDNHAAFIAMLQEAYTFMPAGKRILFCTIPPRPSETTGTAALRFLTTCNNLIKTTFPSNHIDLAAGMAGYGGNASGGTAPSLSDDNLHPNELGVAEVYAPMIEAAIKSRGW